jgi:hypothetical protein
MLGHAKREKAESCTRTMGFAAPLPHLILGKPSLRHQKYAIYGQKFCCTKKKI